VIAVNSTQRLVCVGLALAALTARPVEAGGDERRKWWASDRAKAEIGLSDAQSAAIEDIFQATLPRLRAEKAELDRLEREVSRVLSSVTPDEAAVSQAVDRAEAARSVCNRTRTMMLFGMYRVLTPEQRARLRTYHDRLERERRSDSSRNHPEFHQ
jgi:Spy/CpxP family protein refolding chaperone